MAKTAAMNGKKPSAHMGGKADFGSLKRVIGLLFKNYKGLLFAVGICLVVSAISVSIAGVFLQNLYKQFDMVLKGGSPDEAWRNVLVILSTMLGIYALGWIASLLLGQFGAVLTQRFLRDMRNEMFDKMEKLPIKYFDRNAHGDKERENNGDRQIQSHILQPFQQIPPVVRIHGKNAVIIRPAHKAQRVAVRGHLQLAEAEHQRADQRDHAEQKQSDHERQYKQHSLPPSPPLIAEPPYSAFHEASPPVTASAMHRTAL